MSHVAIQEDLDGKVMIGWRRSATSNTAGNREVIASAMEKRT
jgi:hypothetical protein